MDAQCCPIVQIFCVLIHVPMHLSLDGSISVCMPVCMSVCMSVHMKGQLNPALSEVLEDTSYISKQVIRHSFDCHPDSFIDIA